MSEATKPTQVSQPTATAIRELVRQAYRKVDDGGAGLGDDSTLAARAVGYEADDLDGVAGEANLGIGCGNPHALANIATGEVVLDLGSGAGFDALVAAPNLGDNGRFIGVDMTPEMLARARRNVVKAGFERNIEFREGLIEDLPVSSDSVDVAISNCVINLSPEKDRVFRELYRVLKPGGRIAISDIVLSQPLPDSIPATAGWVACVTGALVEDEYLGAIRSAGFVDVEYTRVNAAALFDTCTSDPLASTLINSLDEATLKQVVASVYSYSITAHKPRE